MNKTLEIELRSDLCTGTGKGFAAVIDEDTAVDEYGIPFIPGKRIKGCLREIAKEIFGFDDKKLEKIFGVSGSSKPGTLDIKDAKIKDYDSQLDDIKAALSEGKIKPNDITELFCSVRSSTAIENDTAKKNSLRFVRVVNRVSPSEGEPLKFYADIEFNENDEADITNLFKALRNIGYHRNRGLGYIKCTLAEAKNNFILKDYTFDKSKEYRFSYLVYLDGDLMLPANDANRSLDYIPGTSVLGAFAAKFVKKYGEAEFNDYFFSPDVRFGNLTVSDKSGTEYMPAPGFLAKIKAAKENEKGVYNMIASYEEDEKKETKPQYKPLKKGYISEEKGYKEPDTEIVYHNAINTKESRENNGGLYTQYCISSGQYFKGYIDVKGNKADKIYQLFDSGKISFGRSKNSQYSHCLIKGDIKIEEISEPKVELKQGCTAAYICESDVALLNNGRYAADLDSLCEALDVDKDNLNQFTRISSRVISGYNSKWNLKKPQFPVIKAGSCIVFEVGTDGEKPGFVLIGAKQNEGFGRIRLIPDAKAFAVKNDDSANTDKKTSESDSWILNEIKKRNADDDILKKAVDNGEKIRLEPSQVGRLTLMCKESGSIADFEKRINSIKTPKTKEEAKRCFGEKALNDILGEGCDWATYRKYILAALTVKKYKLRGDKK